MRIVFTILIIICSFVETRANAQRGASYDGKAKPWNSTTQGFPGYFDGAVAKKDSIVVEFPPMIYGILPMPSVAVDYGLTDSLTIGTNGALSALPYILGAYGGSIKLRSLVIGDDSEQAAATYYGGAIAARGETPFTFYYSLFTWNHEWALDETQTVAFHANYIKLNYEQSSIQDITHAELSYSSALLGLGYGKDFNARWAARVDTLLSVYQSFEADTAALAFNQTSNIKNVKSTSLMGTAQLDWRSSEDWLFGFGVIGVSVAGSRLAAPWFTWATRW